MNYYLPNAAASGLDFKKSSYSGQDNNCVEVAVPGGPATYVRDSKDPEGPALVFPAESLQAFVASAAAGDFDFGLI
ncbi:DUF397 domain-containing protein [Kitasatospora indigofera]|uniref:DUF397 domain-containing protein n=1 Tax=Kitasatospora indigofera TaxID=67307 RepID=UPI0033A605AB